MSRESRARELTYEARARLADNLYLRRRRAGLSQERLAELALVSAGQIGAIELGKSVGMLDSCVRLAGALSISLDELLAGVRWTPGEIELEVDAGYEVEFES
ncbi:MAG TPA: helix-turn-helix transcriptional regulator [Solirubrobacterales bacterium]|nr:helix-turn-helix transcriptional regulator [Solirubrobacterales bacterium]